MKNMKERAPYNNSMRASFSLRRSLRTIELNPIFVVGSLVLIGADK